MLRKAMGWAIGLRKELVAVMLAVALAVTVGVDLSSSALAGHRALHRSGSAGLRLTRPHAAAPSTTAPPVTAPPTSAPPDPSTVPPATPVVRRVPPPPPASQPGPAPAPATPSARSIPFGVYTGSADPSGVASFAAATGVHVTYAADYLPRDSGWAGMTDASQLAWLTSAWRGTGYTLVLGVPMIPTDSSGNPLGTLAGGAAGQYDSYFVTLARTLVAGGEGTAVLRLGWEFNGNWYPWSVSNATDAANFAAFFRNIVIAMRSVPGEAFRFVWNPDGGGASSNGAYSPAQAYPGSAYVDDIGIDMYDQCWSSPATPQNAWAEQVSSTWGLDWVASFAAAQGRPIVFPEWGVTTGAGSYGMGDDPYFIDQFGTWIAQHDVAWTAYFNYDASDGAHDLFDGNFPNALAAFRTVF